MKAGIIKESILISVSKAYRIFGMAKIADFGLILGGKNEIDKNFHSYRLLIDNKKYICGDCGKFIYKRKRNMQDFIVWIRNKFGKTCLGCVIKEANKRRNKVIDGRLVGSMKYAHSIRCKIRFT